jgi:hypothetical protein
MLLPFGKAGLLSAGVDGAQCRFYQTMKNL